MHVKYVNLPDIIYIYIYVYIYMYVNIYYQIWKNNNN